MYKLDRRFTADRLCSAINFYEAILYAETAEEKQQLMKDRYEEQQKDKHSIKAVVKYPKEKYELNHWNLAATKINIHTFFDAVGKTGTYCKVVKNPMEDEY